MRLEYDEKLRKLLDIDWLELAQNKYRTPIEPCIAHEKSYVRLIELGPPQDRAEFRTMIRYMRQAKVLDRGDLDKVIDRIVCFDNIEWIRALLDYAPVKFLFHAAEQRNGLAKALNSLDQSYSEKVFDVAARRVNRQIYSKGLQYMLVIGCLIENPPLAGRIGKHAKNLRKAIDNYDDLLEDNQLAILRKELLTAQVQHDCPEKLGSQQTKPKM